MNSGISIGKGILWVLVWFGFMFIYTALDIVIWRKIAPNYSRILNIITVALSMVVFFVLLERKENFKLNLLENISIQGIVIAICCSVLFYLLLDKGLDPIFESIFASLSENPPSGPMIRAIFEGFCLRFFIKFLTVKLS